MRAEDIVAMAKDAARYRWMRNSEGPAPTLILGEFRGEELDAEVDAEMKVEQE